MGQCLGGQLAQFFPATASTFVLAPVFKREVSKLVLSLLNVLHCLGAGFSVECGQPGSVAATHCGGLVCVLMLLEPHASRGLINELVHYTYNNYCYIIKTQQANKSRSYIICYMAMEYCDIF